MISHKRLANPATEKIQHLILTDLERRKKTSKIQKQITTIMFACYYSSPFVIPIGITGITFSKKLNSSFCDGGHFQLVAT